MADDAILDKVPDQLRGLYTELLAHVLAFGRDVETHTTTRNRLFTAGPRRTFAELQPQPRNDVIRVLIRSDRLGVPESGSQVISGVTVSRVPDSHGWTLNLRIDVDNDTPFQGVLDLLRESYDTVKS